MKKPFLLSSRTTRTIGLLAFIATGAGLIVSAAGNETNLYKTEIILIFASFFAISLQDHFRKLSEKTTSLKLTRRSFYILLCSFVSVTITWFINHEMGYGPIIANGLVGVMAATFLPNDLAGVSYTTSFVGMSSLKVLPTLPSAMLGSVIVALVLIATADIYAGMGGKGGTTAALSTLITRTLLRLFG